MIRRILAALRRWAAPTVEPTRYTRPAVGDDTPRPRHTDAECRRAWGGMPVRCPVPHCGALLTAWPHVCPPRVRGGRRNDEGFDVGGES